jgi:hypothetical protein
LEEVLDLLMVLIGDNFFVSTAQNSLWYAAGAAVAVDC